MMTTPTASPSNPARPGISGGLDPVVESHHRLGRVGIGALLKLSRRTTLATMKRGVRATFAPRLDRSLAPQVRDLRVVVAQPAQDLLGVLAPLRRRGADAARDAGHVDRRGDQLGLPEPPVLHRGGEAEMLDLRVGEHLVDRVDRPARDAGALEQLDPVRRRAWSWSPREIAALIALRSALRPFCVSQPGFLTHSGWPIAFAEPLPQPRRAGRDVDVAVAGREHAGRDAGRMVVAGLAARPRPSSASALPGNPA